MLLFYAFRVLKLELHKIGYGINTQTAHYRLFRFLKYYSYNNSKFVVRDEVMTRNEQQASKFVDKFLNINREKVLFSIF